MFSASWNLQNHANSFVSLQASMSKIELSSLLGCVFLLCRHRWAQKLLLLLWFFTNRKLDFFLCFFVRCASLSVAILSRLLTNELLGLCATFSLPIDHFLMLEVDDWALLTVRSSKLTRKRQLFFAQSESSKSNRLCSTPKRSVILIVTLMFSASWNLRNHGNSV